MCIRDSFWPGIKNSVKQMVEGCSACRARLASQAHLPPVPTTLPKGPMIAVGADLFSHAGINWLVLVDRYSGYLWAARMSSVTTEAVRGFAPSDGPAAFARTAGRNFVSYLLNFARITTLCMSYRRRIIHAAMALLRQP